MLTPPPPEICTQKCRIGMDCSELFQHAGERLFLNLYMNSRILQCLVETDE